MNSASFNFWPVLIACSLSLFLAEMTSDQPSKKFVVVQ
jgi:hypothetical protein